MNAFEHLMNRSKLKPIFTGNMTKAEKYVNTINVDKWVWSELLDGIRVVWNGKHLVTNNNVIVKCPSSWIMTLPKNIALDGVLFIKRGAYNRTISIVKKYLPSSNWKDIKFHVFDSPTMEGTFVERYHQLCKMIQNEKLTMMEIVPQRLIRHNVDNLLYNVQMVGGDGVILRNPDMSYVNGRTFDMLKLKVEEDYDAFVSDIILKCGNMHAIKCIMLPSNTQFVIESGFSNNNRAFPPLVGTKIRYKCEGFSEDNIPISPTFISERVE